MLHQVYPISYSISNVILVARIGPVIAQHAFAGYNDTGTIIPPTTPTPNGATLSTPEPAFSIPITDFSIVDIEQTILNDHSDTSFTLRMLGVIPASPAEIALDNATGYPMGQPGDRRLFFLTRNPDSSFGLFFGPKSRLIIDGSTVRYSDGAQSPVPFAEGMTPAQFIAAVIDEVQ